MQEIEIWKPIAGYEGLYEVSNTQKVRSVDRILNHPTGKCLVKSKIKELQLSNKGYYCLSLYKEGRGKVHLLHRLIAKAFIPNPKNLPEIDHINGNRLDNRIENLRWTTRKGNMNNPVTKERMSKYYLDEDWVDNRMQKRIANKRKTAPKKVYQYTLDGVFLKEYGTTIQAEKETGIKKELITASCRERGRRQAIGYLWSYEKFEKIEYTPYSSNNKKVAQYDLNGNFIREFKSIKEASAILGLHDIGSVCRGIRKTCGGYGWRFI